MNDVPQNSNPSNTDNAIPSHSYVEHDDYLRFLQSLEDDNALPEDDDNDPDFDDDINKLIQDLSDEERDALAPFMLSSSPLPDFQTWNMTDYNQQPSPLLQTPFYGNLNDVGPAWCTRSRYPMTTMDIDELETVLDPLNDYAYHQEMRYLRMPPHDYASEFELRHPIPIDYELRRRQAYSSDGGIDTPMIDTSPPFTMEPGFRETQIDRSPIRLDRMLRSSPSTSHTRSSTQNSNLSTRRLRFGKPSADFTEIFPYELFGKRTEEEDEFSGESSDSVLFVNTLNGVVKMQKEAWTPEMILCLNRIINAHIQLLTQVNPHRSNLNDVLKSFSICLETSYFRNVAEGMHAQLHSMYQLFQLQSDFDYGFDTMLQTQFPKMFSKKECLDRRFASKKKQKSTRRKRKRNVKVDEVIDLTKECDDDSIDEQLTKLSTVLDVPLLHCLPHLWQMLMTIHITKGTYFAKNRSRPLQNKSKRMGLVPSLEVSKDSASALGMIEWMMTCGICPENKHKPVCRKLSWTTSEEALVDYLVALHKGDTKLIQKRYFPNRTLATLVKKVRSGCVHFNMQWEQIEKMLTDTDKTSMLRSINRQRVFNAQTNLCQMCGDFQEMYRNIPTQSSKMLPVMQNVEILESIQKVIKDSTSELVQDLFGHTNLTTANGIDATPVMHNLLCFLLGQVGSHLSGSFDTLFTFMKIIAGMQLINGADSYVQEHAHISEMIRGLLERQNAVSDSHKRTKPMGNEKRMNEMDPSAKF